MVGKLILSCSAASRGFSNSSREWVCFAACFFMKFTARSYSGPRDLVKDRSIAFPAGAPGAGSTQGLPAIKHIKTYHICVYRWRMDTINVFQIILPLEVACVDLGGCARWLRCACRFCGLRWERP